MRAVTVAGELEAEAGATATETLGELAAAAGVTALEALVFLLRGGLVSPEHVLARNQAASEGRVVALEVPVDEATVVAWLRERGGECGCEREA